MTDSEQDSVCRTLVFGSDARQTSSVFGEAGAREQPIQQSRLQGVFVAFLHGGEHRGLDQQFSDARTIF
jgi:hypothetical protein